MAGTNVKRTTRNIIAFIVALHHTLPKNATSLLGPDAHGTQVGPMLEPQPSDDSCQRIIRAQHQHPTTQPTMSLVQYPDSDSDSDSEQNTSLSAQKPKVVLKRKRSELSNDDLPPLPAAFHDLYSTNARVSTSDNPSLHGGRKRAVPHVEGNWPSHIYLECKDDPTPFFESLV